MSNDTPGFGFELLRERETGIEKERERERENKKEKEGRIKREGER